MAGLYPIQGANASNITADASWHQANEKGTSAIDISTSCNPIGGNLVAVENGTFHTFASGSPCGTAPASPNWFGPNAFYIIDTAQKWVYVYGHASSINVADGATVVRNQVIGVEGNLGHVTGSNGCAGTHVHFSVVQKSEWDTGNACNGAKRDDFTTPYLIGAEMPQVSSPVGQPGQFPGNGQSAGLFSNNLASGVMSIVPTRVAYVVDGQVDLKNWYELNSTHDNNFGEVSGMFTIMEEGHLDKILYLNSDNNIVGEAKVDQDVITGDQIHFNHAYSIQDYLGCTNLTKGQMNKIMHYLTVLGNGWEDGHNYQLNDVFDTSTYHKDIDGKELRDVARYTSELNTLLQGITIANRK